MSVEDFRQACTQIWGTRYGVEAAAALGVSARAVHNYGTGIRPVPHTMPARLKACALAHKSVLDAVAAAMDEIMAGAPAPAPTGQPEAAVEAAPAPAADAPAAIPPPVDEADFPEGVEGELEPLGDPDEWDDDV